MRTFDRRYKRRGAPPGRRHTLPLVRVFLALTLLLPTGVKLLGQVPPPPSPDVGAKATPTAIPAGLPEKVLAELNRARTQPALYADFLAGRRAAYQPDKILVLPGQTPLETQEGVAALDEAIAALRALAAVAASPLPALAADEKLARVAWEMADDQAATGATGHIGSDGATLATRLERQGALVGAAGENIAYGPTTAEEIVFSLVVDDGVAGRGHRQNILNGDFHLVGIAAATHPQWGQVCVMDFAQGWR